MLAPSSPDDGIMDEEGTYLVTGGLGGLGLEVAGRLATNGAKHLVLLGRSAPKETAVERIEELRHEGVQVQIEQGDVSSEADVNRIIKNVQATLPALRGVVHCAGVLDDGALFEQAWSRFAKVMAPKISGAWNLHRATMGADLQFFVMFSSIASMLGSVGQGNYAAANAFLDALADYRRSNGLPGLALNWGAWSEVGMAAELGERNDARRAKYGAGTIALEHGLSVFETLLSRDCARMGIMPMNWGDYFSAADNTYPPLLETMAQESKAITRTAAPAAEFLQQLDDVPASERAEFVSNFVSDSIVRILSLNERPDPQQRLTEIGMDSLLALELRNQYERELGVAVSTATLLQGPTVAEFGALMLRKLSVPNQLRPASAAAIDSQDWEVGEL
jgi:aryl carrier-like protein